MSPTVSYRAWVSDRGARHGVHEARLPETARPRVLDRIRAALRVRPYSRRTEEAYVAWIRRYILFHGKRHPAEMGAPELPRVPPRYADPPILRPNCG